MTSSTLLGRGALAAILVAGWLVAPAAAARSADRRPSGKDPARANVYVAPPPDTATRLGQHWLEAHGGAHNLGSRDGRTTAKIILPSLPDFVAEQTGARYATERARLQASARSLPSRAGGGASAWTVIVLAFAGALAGGAGVLFVQRARRTPRAAPSEPGHRVESDSARALLPKHDRNGPGGTRMRAYHRSAVKSKLTTCPLCMRRAEILDRFTLPSTDGPATHLKVRCEDGHVYTVLVDDTPSMN